MLPILQLVQCREQHALWELRQKLGKQRKCKGYRKVDVSAMRHRTTQRKGTREWLTKPNSSKDTNSELWSLIEAESNKIKATPANLTAMQRGDKEQTNANTDKADVTKQDHSNTVSTCATSADAQQTALKRRNQILSDIKKYEAMSFQEGSTGASLEAEAVAKLRTELEQVQQDLHSRCRETSTFERTRERRRSNRS